eukprot:4586193-Pyramimonas_sp.AAC.1
MATLRRRITDCSGSRPCKRSVRAGTTARTRSARPGSPKRATKDWRSSPYLAWSWCNSSESR